MLWPKKSAWQFAVDGAVVQSLLQCLHKMMLHNTQDCLFRIVHFTVKAPGDVHNKIEITFCSPFCEENGAGGKEIVWSFAQSRLYDSFRIFSSSISFCRSFAVIRPKSTLILFSFFRNNWKQQEAEHQLSRWRWVSGIFIVVAVLYTMFNLLDKVENGNEIYSLNTWWGTALNTYLKILTTIKTP